MEKANASAACDAEIIRGGGGHIEQLHARGRFFVQCHDKDGNLKWEDYIDNLVVDTGKNELLDVGLRNQTQNATWYMGLVSSVSFTAYAAGDTMASHGGWTEAAATNAPDYDEAARRTMAWSAAASGSMSLSAALTFTINESGTVKGVFVTDTSTKDGATGTLFSAGNFSGGDKAVVATDVLSVSYTISL